MIGPLHALYEALNAAYDLDQDRLGTTALHAHCVEAVLSSVPPAETEWYAHQLRRRLTDHDRAMGDVRHAGQYRVPGLLDGVGELAGRAGCIVSGDVRVVMRPGDSFRCPACIVGWVHIPPTCPVRRQGRSGALRPLSRPLSGPGSRSAWHGRHRSARAAETG